MYNEGLKTRFIREITNSVHTARLYEVTFNAIEKYEVEHSKDFCEFSSKLAKEVIEKISGIKSSSTATKFEIIRNYSRWCVKNNINGAILNCENIKIDISDKIKQRMVSNPVHLQMFLDNVYTVESELSTDNIYRCYFWLAFSGVEEKDICSITKNDIRLEDMAIVYNGKSYELYKESLPCIKNCIKLSEFQIIHPEYTKNKVYKRRVDGDSLLRGIRGTSSPESIKETISRHLRRMEKLGATNMRLSYGRVFLSGIFYRTRQRELAGIHPDFTDIILKQYESKDHTSDIKEYKQKHKTNFSINYRKWKNAFDL